MNAGLKQLLPGWKPWSLMVAAAILPAAVCWVLVLGDLSEEVDSLGNRVGAIPETDPALVDRLRGSVESLRRENRESMRSFGDDERRLVLTLLAHVDRLIADRGLVLVGRDDPTVAAADPVRRLPQNVRQALSAEQLKARDKARRPEDYPRDVGHASYRHMVQGGYHDLVGLLTDLGRVDAPCRVRDVTLVPVDGSEGWLTLVFTLDILHEK